MDRHASRTLLSGLVVVLAAALALWMLPGRAADRGPSPSLAAQPAALVAQLPAPGANAAGTPAPATQPEPATAPLASSAPPPATEHPLAAALRADLAARWLRNHRETALRAAPDDRAPVFSVLPQWTTLKLLESRADWTRVYLEGDGVARQAGPGWVRTDDIGPVGTPPLWLATARPAPLWAAASGSAGASTALPAETAVEVVGPDPIWDGRIRVRLPGDGRAVPPGQGWVEAADVRRTPAPPPDLLPWAYPSVLAADVRLRVPYRSQLDGSPYEGANCGPATLGMLLEAFGLNVPSGVLRRQVLLAQDMSPANDDAGSYVWALARVAESYGLRINGLYAGDGVTLRRWTLLEVRQRVRQGEPVILQVRYRALPRRAASPYYGDHYIVVTGLMGESFLYNDSIGGPLEREGPGWDRVISGPELIRAMDASDRAYAYTGFAVGGGSAPSAGR